MKDARLGSELDSRHDAQLDYRKMSKVAEEKGLAIFDVVRDGDCALHAVNGQLQRQGTSHYDVRTLRRWAVEQLQLNSNLVNLDMIRKCYGGDIKAYFKQQAEKGTLCDDAMLHAVAMVTKRDIHLFDDNGCVTKFEPHKAYTGKLITIGRIAGIHYVSLEPRDTSSNKHPTKTDELPITSSASAGTSERTKGQKQHQSEEAIQDTSPSHASAANDKPPIASADTCAICMDVIKDPKTLPCAHVFCSECIDQSLKYQPKCPCCGKILGVIKGDQPDGGTMTVRKDKWSDLEGYPRCGRIIIEYYIPNGRQKV